MKTHTGTWLFTPPLKDVSRETLRLMSEDVHDPWESDLRVSAFFGDQYDTVAAFANLLAKHGTERGLIGPRELPRLWERHILNSAAVAQFLPPGSLVDVGSGAGLPGVVLAAMEPSRAVTLVEPMERRVAWLTEVAHSLDLSNITVVRGRAEEVADRVKASVVTARAVAPVAKLVKWAAPLLIPGGEMVLLKGRNAEQECEEAKHVLRKVGLRAQVEEASTVEGAEPTRVVLLRPGPAS